MIQYLIMGIISRYNKCRKYPYVNSLYTTPCECMASETFLKAAILAPTT